METCWFDVEPAVLGHFQLGALIRRLDSLYYLDFDSILSRRILSGGGSIVPFPRGVTKIPFKEYDKKIICQHLNVKKAARNAHFSGPPQFDQDGQVIFPFLSSASEHSFELDDTKLVMYELEGNLLQPTESFIIDCLEQIKERIQEEKYLEDWSLFMVTGIIGAESAEVIPPVSTKEEGARGDTARSQEGKNAGGKQDFERRISHSFSAIRVAKIPINLCSLTWNEEGNEDDTGAPDVDVHNKKNWMEDLRTTLASEGLVSSAIFCHENYTFVLGQGTLLSSSPRDVSH